MIRLYVYGTLKSDITCGWLDVHPKSKTPATLRGYRKQGLNIYKDPESSVDGYLLEISPEELARIDSYEAGYKKIEVEVGGDTAIAYKIID